MDQVEGILKNLEEKNDIKIIFAVEAGSRAWGLESEDSDFDIRFVYFHNKTRSYLSMKPIKETIDGFSEDRVYDWQGWDITKALKLVQTMNPSIAEWIYSPIVYLNDTNKFDFPNSVKRLLEDQKRLAPLLFHYRSMAKSNYKAHIDQKNKVNIKKYLYVIRPAGMVIWLMNKKSKSIDNKENKFIEIDFNKVLNEIKPNLSDECYEKIVSIIKIKKTLKEVDEGERIECVDKWIESVLNTKNEDLLKNDDFNEERLTVDGYDKLLHSILNISFND